MTAPNLRGLMARAGADNPEVAFFAPSAPVRVIVSNTGAAAFSSLMRKPDTAARCRMFSSEKAPVSRASVSRVVTLELTPRR